MKAISHSAPTLPVTPHFPASYQRSSQYVTSSYLNRTVFISVDDILYFEGDGNYTFLHTRDQKQFLVSKTLKEFEKTLDVSMFLRTHKSCIINLAYVQKSFCKRERYLRMADGRELAISRRRMKIISFRLAQFWQQLIN